MFEQISQIIAQGIINIGNIVGTWLSEHLANVIVILIAAWFAKRFGTAIMSQLLKRTIRPDIYPTKADREKRLKTLDSLIGAVVKVAVYLIAGFMLIGEVNPNYTAALFAGAGLITIAVGFGAQSLVKDFMSGLFIIIENQYRVGDIITIAGVSGTVEDVTIRTTVLRDISGSTHHVPNGIIDVTTNLTIGFSKIFEEIVVGFDTDMTRLEHVINHVGEEMKANPELSRKIIEAPYFAHIKGYAYNGMVVRIYGKTTPGDQWTVRTEMYKRLKKAFEKAGISVTNDLPISITPPTASNPKKKR